MKYFFSLSVGIPISPQVGLWQNDRTFFVSVRNISTKRHSLLASEIDWYAICIVSVFECRSEPHLPFYVFHFLDK